MVAEWADSKHTCKAGDITHCDCNHIVLDSVKPSCYGFDLECYDLGFLLVGISQPV